MTQTAPRDPPHPVEPYLDAGLPVVQSWNGEKDGGPAGWNRRDTLDKRKKSPFLTRDAALKAANRGKLLLAIPGDGYGILDFDTKTFTDAKGAFDAKAFDGEVEKVLAHFGFPPDTPYIQTPSGGRHVPFWIDGDYRLKKDCRFGRKEVWIDVLTNRYPNDPNRTGTDLAGVAGTTKKSGGAYKWVGDPTDAFIEAHALTREQWESIPGGSQLLSGEEHVFEAPLDKVGEDQIAKYFEAFDIHHFKDNPGWGVVLRVASDQFGGGAYDHAWAWSAGDPDQFETDKPFLESWRAKASSNEGAGPKFLAKYLANRPGVDWATLGMVFGMDLMTGFGDLDDGGVVETGGTKAKPGGKKPTKAQAAQKVMDQQGRDARSTNWWVDNERWRILGTNAEGVFLFLKRTGDLKYVRGSAMATTATIQAMCPRRRFWAPMNIDWDKQPSRNRFSSLMLEAAQTVGRYEDNGTVSAGAFKVDGKSWFHVGDKVLDDEGGEQPLGVHGGKVCVAGSRKKLRHADDMEAVVEWAEAMQGYRWKEPAHGAAFVGWAVCSILAGVLKWRPSMWLSAGSGKGKTWLFDEGCLSSVYGDLFPRPPRMASGTNSTPASLGRLMTEALPFVIEEAENDRNNHLEDALKLMRLASDGMAARTVVDMDTSGIRAIRPMCCTLFLATTTATMDPADKSRITTVGLGPPVADWPKVRDRITAASAKGAAIRGTIIKHAAAIMESIEKAEAVAVNSGATVRSSKQVGALMGAAMWAMGGKSDLVALATDSMVEKSKNTETTTAPALLAHLTTGMVQQEGGGNVTVINLIHESITDKESRARLLNFGMKVVQPHKGDRYVMVCGEAAQIKAMLRRTRWAAVSVTKILADLEGAWLPKNGDSRLKVGGMYRGLVCLPMVYFDKPAHIEAEEQRLGPLGGDPEDISDLSGEAVKDAQGLDAEL